MKLFAAMLALTMASLPAAPLLAAASASSASDGVERRGAQRTFRSIPYAFRGHWAGSATQCAPGPADGGNIRITGRSIQSFESRTNVVRVRMVGPNSIEYAGRGYNGGAESYGDLNRLTLLDGRSRLAIGDGEDRVFYVRCRR